MAKHPFDSTPLLVGWRIYSTSDSKQLTTTGLHLIFRSNIKYLWSLTRKVTATLRLANNTKFQYEKCMCLCWQSKIDFSLLISLTLFFSTIWFTFFPAKRNKYEHITIIYEPHTHTYTGKMMFNFYSWRIIDIETDADIFTELFSMSNNTEFHQKKKKFFIRRTVRHPFLCRIGWFFTSFRILILFFFFRCLCQSLYI